MSLRPRVLVVDDDEIVLDSILLTLRKEFDLVRATSGKEALSRLEAEDGIAVVLADQRMPGMSGVELLTEVRARFPLAVRMILTGYKDVSDLIDAINAGHVFGYLTKPWERDELVSSVRRGVEHYLLNLENRRLREEIDVRNRALEAENARLRRIVTACGRGDHIILGSTPAFLRALEVVEQAAPTDAPVLITGESGTGKELFAREIHRRSRRAAQPFVAINCGALPDALVESELFGHVRGAFTGATRDRPGRFAEAHSGTIFLDEVGDLGRDIQVKLLRALQSGEVYPVGATGSRCVDVRIVAATCRPLRDLVAASSFREDLFYRLNVVPVELPPLRARRGDVPDLARRFLGIAAAEVGSPVEDISPEALARMACYQFPGNIRELENIMRRMVILARGRRLELGDLPPEVSPVLPALPESDLPSVRTNEELKAARREVCKRSRRLVERRLLEHVLGEAGGSVSEAARRAGMNRTQLQQLVAEHGIKASDFRRDGS